MNRRSFLLALPVAAAAAKVLAEPENGWREHVEVGPWDICCDYDTLGSEVYGSGPVFTEDLAQRVFDSWARSNGAPLSFGAAIEPHLKGPDGYLIRRAR